MHSWFIFHAFSSTGVYFLFNIQELNPRWFYNFYYIISVSYLSIWIVNFTENNQELKKVPMETTVNCLNEASRLSSLTHSKIVHAVKSVHGLNRTRIIPLFIFNEINFPEIPGVFLNNIIISIWNKQLKSLDKVLLKKYETQA